MNFWESQNQDFITVTEKEVRSAQNSLNKGKWADNHGVIIEHLLYAIKEVIPFLTILINTIYEFSEFVSDSLKEGVLIPVF